MLLERQKFYPGETATPVAVIVLADEYRRAADILMPTNRRGAPLSQAPYRLVAIHAVELYLNALLLSAGHSSTGLRALHHDLAARTQLALRARLNLRARTIAHLHCLFETREYLSTRYDPAATGSSHINRLGATLSEVAEKVTRLVHQSGA